MTAGLRYFVSPTEDLQASTVVVPRPGPEVTVRRRPGRVVGTYLLAVTAAVAAALVLGGGAVAWWAAAGGSVVLALELERLPSYARPTSLRPAGHLLAGTGAVLLLATATGLASPAQVRTALSIALLASAASAASAVTDRLVRPRCAALLVGDERGAGDLVRQWQGRRDVEVRGVCLAGRAQVSAVLGERVLGGPADVPELAEKLGVDSVVVAPGPELSAYDVRRLGWALEGSRVELCVASEIHGAVPHRVTSRMVGQRLVFSVRPGTRTGARIVVKDVIDRVGAAVLLALLSPLFLLVALLVRADSSGPVFFSQERTGRGDTRFRMLKFRTMCADAEARLAELREHNEADGPLFKISADPRVTRIGAVLRKTSLDELPQLVNVLRGQMSLIGPRPALPSETATYDDWTRHRLQVKPGMTGAWQVGGRSRLSWQDSVRLDIDYVDNWTLSDDLAIAAKTARAVVGREGAH